MNQFEQDIYTAVVDGNTSGVKSGVQAGLEAGQAADALLNNGLIAAMKEVGRLFEEGEYFVPEMLISAAGYAGGYGDFTPNPGGTGHQTHWQSSDRHSQR